MGDSPELMFLDSSFSNDLIRSSALNAVVTAKLPKEGRHLMDTADKARWTMFAVWETTLFDRFVQGINSKWRSTESSTRKECTVHLKIICNDFFTINVGLQNFTECFYH